MATTKLKPEHRQFIVQQRAMFVFSNTEIAKRLEDKEFAEERLPGTFPARRN